MGYVNITRTLAITPVIKTGAYSAGDVVGGLIDLTGLCGGGGGGFLRSILMVDDANQKLALDVYLFDGKPTVILDDAVFATAILVGDLVKLVKVVSIAAVDYITINGNAYALKDGLAISHGTGQLWAYIVTNGSTPTYGAVDAITIKVTGNKD